MVTRASDPGAMALSLPAPARRLRPVRRAGTGRPLVVAHRGASGHRPEHTLAAYELAFTLGADSVELDLLATRDGALVCRHDLELSRTTDVAARPEFAHLRRTVVVDGTPVTGWFVHDFDLAELRTLRAKERWPRKRPISASFSGRYPIPTLEDVLALVDRESAARGVPLGIHAELKEPRALAALDLDLAALVADRRAAARPEITWFSFDSRVLRRLDVAGPVLRLYDKTPNGLALSRAAEYAAGIAVKRKSIHARLADGSLGAPTNLVEKAHRRGLSVAVWTHRAENQHLPTNYRIGGNAHGHGDAVGEAAALYAAGIDALITDFPQIAAQARAQSIRRSLG